MADLKKIEYPSYLNEHTLSEQALAALSPEQRPLAKDWNRFTNKIDWLIAETVTQHNILVDHDKWLEIWRKVLWLCGMLVSCTGIIAIVLKFFL